MFGMVATTVQALSATSGQAAAGDAFIGLQPGLGSLPLLGRGRTRSISAENPTGEKGKGGMAIPNPNEPKPVAAARAADNLGQGWKVRPFIRINAGETAVLMDVAGPGVIQHIWLVEGLNRGLVIRFFWDGEETPSVEVPVPDFFAVGHGRFALVNSPAVVVNPANALNCFWPMPFRTRARITLSNETGGDVELVAYQITYVETEVPADAGTFHAQYRGASVTEQNPYIILDGVKGRGRYVGTFLAWTQMEKGWFGEGEIKFYLDGDDRFPTICGTGTEDYFLGSYGFPKPFTTAYSGSVLPVSDRGEPPKFWSLYRWHIQDPINFDEDLRVTIQALGWGSDGKYKKLADDIISSVAYWYQAEPHAPFPKLPTLAERLHTVNLATGKPVTVSGGTQGSNLPRNAVDGVTSNDSGWHTAPWPQWLQVDLGKSCSIDRVKVFTYYGDGRCYQYTVEASTDGKEWKQIVDMSRNTKASTEAADDHTFPAVQARYVRVQLLKNSANEGVHLNELMVFKAK